MLEYILLYILVPYIVVFMYVRILLMEKGVSAKYGNIKGEGKYTHHIIINE